MDFETSMPPPQSLEQVRAKIQQLTTSLQALQHRIQSSASTTTSTTNGGSSGGGTTLPPWSQIQSSLGVILTQLASLMDTLLVSEDETKTVVGFPNALFPVTTHEGLLTTLMRSKPLPDSDAWLGEARKVGEALEPVEAFKWPMNRRATLGGSTAAEQEQQEEEEDLPGDEYDIGEWLAMQRSSRQWSGFYTKKEVDDAFEIDRDDLDDIRRARQVESSKALVDMKAMLRFSRSGR